MQENEKKVYGIVWAVVITVTLLLSTIPMALQAQGNLPTASDKQPEISREELAKIDDELAVLMDLRDHWIVERFPVEVAEEMRERIKNFPQCLEIHRKFMEGLKSELDQGKVELVPKREKSLPPRHNCVDIPGHLTCFKTHDGLIHGGVIKMPLGTTLVCRAYRLVYMSRYHGSHSYKRDERREAVVAGVCEKKNSAGQVLERWSTAWNLPRKYVDNKYYWTASAFLPTPAVQRIYYKPESNRWTAAWFGYYFPFGWNRINGKDTGTPTYEHWKELGYGSTVEDYIWKYPPADNIAVESPTYNFPEICPPGYVICTPYLKVYHPNASSEEAIVWLRGALRLQEQRKMNIVARARHDKWYTKTFRVEN